MIENVALKKNGFTPLEKDTDSNQGWNGTCKIDGSLKPSSKHTIRERRTLAGFTLIEILIALTILGIGLVSVLSYLPIALNASKKAADITTASLIARKCIEEIKAASFDDITVADAYDTSGIYTADSDFAGFSYLIAISNAGASDTKDVTVTVRWTFKGKDNLETFNTMIVKYNPS